MGWSSCRGVSYGVILTLPSDWMVLHWGCRIHRPLFWATIEGLDVVAGSSVATRLAPRRCDDPKTQWRGARQIPWHAVFLPMRRSSAHGRQFQQAAAQGTVVHQGRTWLVRCRRRWIIIFRCLVCDCCGTRRRKSIVPLIYRDQLVMHYFTLRLLNALRQQACVILLSKLKLILIIFVFS